jgi:predicted CopG family antitoxin
MYFSYTTDYMMNRSYTKTSHNGTTTGSKRCTISIDRKIYSRLKEEGRFGESFSELVGRLLDRVKEKPAGGKTLQRAAVWRNNNGEKKRNDFQY